MKPRTARWLTDVERKVLAGLVLLGAVAFGIGVARTPSRAWADLLVVNYYLLTISLGAAVFICAHYLAGAGWTTLFRRVPEAMTGYLPAGAVLMVVLLLAVRVLYPWAFPSAAADPILQAKAGWLNVTGFRVRTVLYLFIWIFLARRIVANSRAQDESRDVSLTAKNLVASSVFVVVFALTFTLAGIDWMMSLEPHWFSTIYPWYLFASLFVASQAVLTLLLLLMHRRGFCQGINSAHLHDLGKYLFGFSVFWAYLWFSQYLLTWYTNMPDEVAHFLSRTAGSWDALFWCNVFLCFIAPFALLLSATRKKREGALAAGCVVIIVGHLLDVYMQVGPQVLSHGPQLGPLEAGIVLGGAALFVLLFDRSFAEVSSVPVGDPYLVESLHHHG
ncbi:MAG: hypothetical protein KGL53_10875 [Elusimicrobia bacterium]|nr:hypothetical protein [Elusimicrobiota bacterium]